MLLLTFFGMRTYLRDKTEQGDKRKKKERNNKQEKCKTIGVISEKPLQPRYSHLIRLLRHNIK